MLLVSAMHGETLADGSSLLLWDVTKGQVVKRLANAEQIVPKLLHFLTSGYVDQENTGAAAPLDRLPTGRPAQQ
jgi:hypothetical protein